MKSIQDILKRWLFHINLRYLEIEFEISWIRFQDILNSIWKEFKISWIVREFKISWIRFQDILNSISRYLEFNHNSRYLEFLPKTVQVKYWLLPCPLKQVPEKRSQEVNRFALDMTYEQDLKGAVIVTQNSGHNLRYLEFVKHSRYLEIEFKISWNTFQDISNWH